jgi:hypothetical protein
LLTVTRNVYYCEFCKRHRLTRNAIEKHEPRCIYNPNRSMCGWHMSEVPAAADLAVAFADDPDVGWLRRATDGCPACMLAVVVQAGLTVEDRRDLAFSYDDEVERFRKEEREGVEVF